MLFRKDAYVINNGKLMLCVESLIGAKARTPHGSSEMPLLQQSSPDP